MDMGEENDLIGKIKFCWDAQYFYIGADIIDDFPLVNPHQNENIWMGDCLEFVIGTEPKADKGRTSFAEGDYQVLVSSGTKTAKPTIWIWTKERAAAGYELVAGKKAGGYTLEAKIPWSNFNNFIPKSGLKIGFDFAVDDADETEQRETQSVWSGDSSFHENPSVWGILEFSE